jgi:hypothetical protein
MSTYYTQGQQPGPINFSSWSETEGHEQQQLSAPSAPSAPPAQNNQPIPQQQFAEDPNATKLFREHFRTARDNAIPRSSAGPPDESSSSSSGESWYREYWYVLVIIAVFIVVAIGFYYKSKNPGQIGSAPVSASAPAVSSSPGLSESPNQMFSNYNNRFGSSGLSSANGILNDLEFL